MRSAPWMPRIRIKPPQNHRPKGFLTALGTLCALFGCTDGIGPTAFVQPRAKPEWVVGEAAAALDTVSGLFRLALPSGLHVSLATAESLAVAVVPVYASTGPFSNTRAVLEADRGAPIAFDRLRTCARVTYSQSAFVDFPPEVPPYLRRAKGSAWAIPLCGSDGSVHVSVGVPDNPTDLRVVNGELKIPQGGGSAYFASAGVPVRFSWGLPLTPEGAVAAVFESTGRRVSTLPTAYDQRDDNGIGQLPLCASWRLEVELPVTVRRDIDGQEESVREFFVRRGPACYSEDVLLYITADNQPATAWLFFPIDTSGSGTTMDSAKVNLSGPIRFDRVTVARGVF